MKIITSGIFIFILAIKLNLIEVYDEIDTLIDDLFYAEDLSGANIQLIRQLQKNMKPYESNALIRKIPEIRAIYIDEAKNIKNLSSFYDMIVVRKFCETYVEFLEDYHTILLKEDELYSNESQIAADSDKAIENMYCEFNKIGFSRDQVDEYTRRIDKIMISAAFMAIASRFEEDKKKYSEIVTAIDSFCLTYLEKMIIFYKNVYIFLN